MSSLDDMKVETQLQVAYLANGQLLKELLKYAIGEWPAMKRVMGCESSFPSTANSERRRRLDVLLAMLYGFLVRN